MSNKTLDDLLGVYQWAILKSTTLPVSMPAAARSDAHKLVKAQIAEAIQNIISKPSFDTGHENAAAMIARNQLIAEQNRRASEFLGSALLGEDIVK